MKSLAFLFLTASALANPLDNPNNPSGQMTLSYSAKSPVPSSTPPIFVVRVTPQAITVEEIAPMVKPIAPQESRLSRLCKKIRAWWYCKEAAVK